MNNYNSILLHQLIDVWKIKKRAGINSCADLPFEVEEIMHNQTRSSRCKVHEEEWNIFA